MLKIIFNNNEMTELTTSNEMIELIKLHFSTPLIENDNEQLQHIINEMTDAHVAWSKEKNMHKFMQSYECWQWEHFIKDIKKMMNVNENAMIYVTM